MPRVFRFTAGIAALLLAACSGGDERPSLNLELIGVVQRNLATRLGPQPEAPVVTRAVLDDLEGSFMEVVVERRNQLAYLYVSAARQDVTRGTYIVWRSEDDASMTLRNDVLVATSGIGGDVLSSEVRVVPSQVGPGTSGERRMYISAGDNQSVPITFACEVVDLGPETIEVVERRHRTRHLQESCVGGGGEIVNDYWVDPAAGLAWQSRQWAGPEIGYMRFRRLTNG